MGKDMFIEAYVIGHYQLYSYLSSVLRVRGALKIS